MEKVSVVWKEAIAQYHPGQEWLWRAGGFGVFDPGVNALSILSRILPQRLRVRGADLFIQAGAETPIAAHVALAIEDRPEPCGMADFDGRGEGDALREIAVTTRAGSVLRLANSGSRLLVDDRVAVDGDRAEYPRLYDYFAGLLQAAPAKSTRYRSASLTMRWRQGVGSRYQAGTDPAGRPRRSHAMTEVARKPRDTGTVRDRTEGPGIGFSVARFNLKTGALSKPKLVLEAPMPAYFVISRDEGNSTPAIPATRFTASPMAESAPMRWMRRLAR